MESQTPSTAHDKGSSKETDAQKNSTEHVDEEKQMLRDKVEKLEKELREERNISRELSHQLKQLKFSNQTLVICTHLQNFACKTTTIFCLVWFWRIN
jgi:predicted RNase H-like nuclease (RuvC/YqgF family)